jgi:hypothetical protein
MLVRNQDLVDELQRHFERSKVCRNTRSNIEQQLLLSSLHKDPSRCLTAPRVRRPSTKKCHPQLVNSKFLAWKKVLRALLT